MKRSCLFSQTFVVTDPETMFLLFDHRLLTSAYSKRPPDLNSRKRKLFTLARQVPEISTWVGEEEANGEYEDYREKLRKHLSADTSEDRQRKAFSAKVCLPLRLLPEEARTGVTCGLITISQSTPGVWIAKAAHTTSLTKDLDVPKDKDERKEEDKVQESWPVETTSFEDTSWAVYFDLWKKGWIITKGSNFGCDFLLYTSDPGTSHSTFMICVEDGGEQHPVEWTAMTALATKVRKTALLAAVKDEAVSFTLLEGCLFRKSDFLKGKALEKQALMEEQQQEELRKQRADPLKYAAILQDEGTECTSVAV